MIFHGHEHYSREKNDIRPAEHPESPIAGSKRGGRHEKNANPDAKNPDETNIVGGFALHNTRDERNVKKRQYATSPSADVIEDFHVDPVRDRKR